ncbi:unnamed protein product [Urochloa humidicola]
MRVAPGAASACARKEKNGASPAPIHGRRVAAVKLGHKNQLLLHKSSNYYTNRMIRLLHESNECYTNRIDLGHLQEVSNPPGRHRCNASERKPPVQEG